MITEQQQTTSINLGNSKNVVIVRENHEFSKTMGCLSFTIISTVIYESRIKIAQLLITG